jgi:hypothetical protein
MAYLPQLEQWIDQTRATLDGLDRKIQQASPDQGVHDMAMTLTVWQAVSDRYHDLDRTWDSGRVTEVQLRTLGAMIWGNLNDMLTPGTTLTTGGGLALSLPEACRMLDALVTQLSTRYQLGPVAPQAAARIAGLRAQLERIRQQVALDPPQILATTAGPVNQLSHDVDELVAMADRGGDIGGIIGPLEARAARMERDLIVAHAERAQLAAAVGQARNRQAQLIAREQAVTTLVAATQAEVTPAPKYAVPHVEALGPVPNTIADLPAYLAKLDQVNRALDLVQQANLQANARKQGLAQRFQAARTAASANQSLTQTLGTQIEQLLTSRPAPLDVIEPLIAALETAGRQSS